MNSNFDTCHLDAPAIDCGEDNASIPSSAVNERLPLGVVHALEISRKDPKIPNVPFQSIPNHGTESPMLTKILPGNMLGLEMLDESGIALSYFSTKRKAVDDVDGTPCGPTLSEHLELAQPFSYSSDNIHRSLLALVLEEIYVLDLYRLATLAPSNSIPTPKSPSKSVRFNALVAAATFNPNNFVYRQLDVDRDEPTSAPLNRALETGLKSCSR